MNTISFRQAMEDAKPDAAALRNAGLNTSEVAEIVSSFDVIDRPAREQFSLSDPTLSAIFSENDLSHVEIGMVRFHRNPQKVSTGWIIGEVEADYLMLDNRTGEVIVTDVAAPDHIIWKCARDGRSFLDALPLAAKYLGARMCENVSGDNSQSTTLFHCIELAGGKEYSDFYHMLLAVQ